MRTCQTRRSRFLALAFRVVVSLILFQTSPPESCFFTISITRVPHNAPPITDSSFDSKSFFLLRNHHLHLQPPFLIFTLGPTFSFLFFSLWAFFLSTHFLLDFQFPFPHFTVFTPLCFFIF